MFFSIFFFFGFVRVCVCVFIASISVNKQRMIVQLSSCGDLFQYLVDNKDIQNDNSSYSYDYNDSTSNTSTNNSNSNSTTATTSTTTASTTNNVNENVDNDGSSSRRVTPLCLSEESRSALLLQRLLRDVPLRTAQRLYRRGLFVKNLFFVFFLLKKTL